MIKLNEHRDVKLYKNLLDYFERLAIIYRKSGVDKTYKHLLKHGLRSMPDDDRAQEILEYMVVNYPPSVLLNKTFADLPVDVRPIYKIGNAKLVAFWKTEDSLSNKLFDLLGHEVHGHWTDARGNKITLIKIGEVK